MKNKVEISSIHLKFQRMLFCWKTTLPLKICVWYLLLRYRALEFIVLAIMHPIIFPFFHQFSLFGLPKNLYCFWWCLRMPFYLQLSMNPDLFLKNTLRFVRLFSHKYFLHGSCLPLSFLKCLLKRRAFNFYEHQCMCFYSIYDHAFSVKVVKSFIYPRLWRVFFPY